MECSVFGCPTSWEPKPGNPSCAGNPCTNDDLNTCCSPPTTPTPGPPSSCTMLVCPSGWSPKPGDPQCAANPCAQADLETCCQQVVTTEPLSTAGPTVGPETTTPTPIVIATLAPNNAQTLAPT